MNIECASAVEDRCVPDGQSFFRGLRSLLIKHLQRLPPLFPGSPRHNPGTPNQNWSRFRDEAIETRILVDGDGPLTEEEMFKRLRTGGQCLSRNRVGHTVAVDAKSGA
jgi:hypothetical protein